MTTPHIPPTHLPPPPIAQDPNEAAEPSVGELFGRMTEQVSRLIQAEIQLAKTELMRKVTKLGVGAAMFVAAGVLALYALSKLFDAAAWGLAAWLAPGWGFLIVGALLLIIAGVLVAVGARALRSATPVKPERAMKNVKDDVDSVKKGVKR